MAPSRQADEPNRVDEEECFESIDKLIIQGINAGDVKKLKDAGIYTCNGLRKHTKKSLTGIKGLSEAKVYKICEAAEKLLMNGSIPKNTAVICLDEIDYKKITQSYIVAVKHLDDWLRDGEKVVDVSCLFGPGHDVVGTQDGILKMIFEVEGSFLIVPIEGSNLYLRGFSNEYGDFELNFQDPNIVQDNSCTLLDLGVNYHHLLGGSLEKTMTGLWPLREAVLKLCILLLWNLNCSISSLTCSS